MLADESPRTYLKELSEIRFPGVAVEEASYYEFPPINVTKINLPWTRRHFPNFEASQV
jgi:hypothetical protein